VSCAQGRRATRLRYAPTSVSCYSNVLSGFASMAAESTAQTGTHRARNIAAAPPLTHGRHGTGNYGCHSGPELLAPEAVSMVSGNWLVPSAFITQMLKVPFVLRLSVPFRAPDE